MNSYLLVDSFQHGLLSRGLLMVFGGFDYSGKLNLAFSSDRMKVTDCPEMFETYLLAFTEKIGGLSWVFMQKNYP